MGVKRRPSQLPQAKMLALVLLPALLVVSNAAPGGYTGLGGLYKNMNQNADYMPHAKNAAKLATQIAFEEDESLTGVQAVRPARRASVYVPTFHIRASTQCCRRFSSSASEDQQADPAGESAPLLQCLQGSKPAGGLPVKQCRGR